MNVPQLLQSENEGIRNRAIRQFLIELQINPISSLAYFQFFPKFLIADYFHGKNEKKLIFASVIPKVINLAEKKIDEIPLNTKIDLFHFFVECVKNCITVPEQPKNQNNLIFYPNTYFSILEKLFSSHPKEIFEVLNSEELIILLKYAIGKEQLSNMIDQIVELIVKSPEEYASSFVFLVDNNLSTPIPFQCIQKLHNEHKELFYKHFSMFQNFMRANYPQEFQNISANISPDEISSKYFDDIVGVAKSAQFNPTYGSITDKTQKIQYKLTNSPEQDGEQILNLIKRNSSYELLTTNEKAVAHLPSLQNGNSRDSSDQNDPLMRRRGSSISMQKKRLASYGEKKGGLGHKSWQKRFLEFYPHNNCIVWKEDSNSKEVKGVLILTQNATITLKTKTTGHLFKIIINPGEKQKSYEISFDTETVAKEWFSSLKAACAEMKKK